MKSSCLYSLKLKIIFSVILALCVSSVQAAEDGMDTNLTCAAYYFTLSVFAPKLVNDLTVDQAVKASFAFRKQIDGALYSTKSISIDAFTKKWMELDKEILRPATPEDISTFRAKYESTCKPLLEKVWCEAYKDRAQSACAD